MWCGDRRTDPPPREVLPVMWELHATPAAMTAGDRAPDADLRTRAARSNRRNTEFEGKRKAGGGHHDIFIAQFMASGADILMKIVQTVCGKWDLEKSAYSTDITATCARPQIRTPKKRRKGDCAVHPKGARCMVKRGAETPSRPAPTYKAQTHTMVASQAETALNNRAVSWMDFTASY